MTTLVSGSIAYDSIMVFQDAFKAHILPEKTHQLNVAFLIPEIQREYGGCAGNIAYNLALLEEPFRVLATAGHDFAPYQEWLARNGVDTSGILMVEKAFTAQAFIITDIENNQITAFHPGAMAYSNRNVIADTEEYRLAIIAPDDLRGMLDHCQQLQRNHTPIMFDPGQQLPQFSATELKTCLACSQYLVVNDYEASLLSHKLEMSLDKLAKELTALIVTKGGEGSVIYAEQQQIQIPAVAANSCDPTGCGDAYRAGLIYGITHDLDWQRTGNLAAIIGAIKVASHGTQNHRFDLASIDNTYHQQFGSYLR